MAGRKSKVEKEKQLQIYKRYQHRLFEKDGRLRKKGCSIYKLIGMRMSETMTANAVYLAVRRLTDHWSVTKKF